MMYGNLLHTTVLISQIQGIDFYPSLRPGANADSFIINIFKSAIHRITASIWMLVVIYRIQMLSFMRESVSFHCHII